MNIFKALYLKYRHKFISIATIILAILGLVQLYYVFEIDPISNDECLWVTEKVSADSTAVIFRQVKKNGVTWNAGIRDGNQLLAIDNVKIIRVDIASKVLNAFKEGTFARYTVKNNHVIFETNVYVKKLVDFPRLSFISLGLIWLLVGFIVLMAKPEGKTQKLFYLIGAAYIISQVFIFIPSELRRLTYLNFPSWETFWAILSAIGIGFVAPMTIHFFWIFPKPFKFVKKSVLRAVYIFSFVCLITGIFTRHFLAANFDEHGGLVKILSRFELVFFSFIIISLISLIINYRRLKDSREKKSIFVIMICYILGVSSILYTVSLANVLTDNIFNAPEYFMPVILVVLIPISFGYAIFKYQLMDVSIVVKTAIIYGAATITVAAAYFGIMYAISQSIGTAVGKEYSSIVAIVTFIIFALIFQSTKEKFQDLLTRKFYPEQFAYQKVILKFSNDVMTIVGLENILDSMQETFVKALRLNRFGILLKDSQSDSFIPKKMYGFNSNPIENTSHNFTEYVREKLLIGGPIVIDQQQFQAVFPEHYQKLIEAEIYTIIPMIIKAKVIGLLLFGLKYSGSQFAGKDLDLLCAAANQACVSIENARLYESEAQKITLERDLALAKRIQQGLLPKAVPHFNGLDISGEMIPAFQVGGDYFDIIEVGPGKLFILVSDVSGKGLSASLYMSKLQTIMRIQCVDGKSPKEILIEANRKIYESIERNWFITLSLALVDTNKQTIRFCRAGHSELLLVNSAEPVYYKPKGIGLGLEEGKIFADTLEEIELKYHPGQIYAFFSDGISEAMNEKNELFGIDELSKTISTNKNNSASEIVSCVMKSIEKFRGNREQNDDITMVLIKAK